jgi:hypothetical protein
LHHFVKLRDNLLQVDIDLGLGGAVNDPVGFVRPDNAAGEAAVHQFHDTFQGVNGNFLLFDRAFPHLGDDPDELSAQSGLQGGFFKYRRVQRVDPGLQVCSEKLIDYKG